jgi:hypothetical protein
VRRCTFRLRYARSQRNAHAVPHGAVLRRTTGGHRGWALSPHWRGFCVVTGAAADGVPQRTEAANRDRSPRGKHSTVRACVCMRARAGGCACASAMLGLRARGFVHHTRPCNTVPVADPKYSRMRRVLHYASARVHRAHLRVCTQAKISRIDEVVAEIQADQNAYGWVIDNGPGGRLPISVFELAGSEASSAAEALPPHPATHTHRGHDLTH